jgi:hypothetical protein
MPVHGGRSVDDVRAGALERGVPAEGALSLRARRTSPEGALSLRARRTSPEGVLRPSSEANLT